MVTSNAVRDFGSGSHRFRDPFEPGPSSERLERLVGKWRPDRATVAHFRRAHFEGDPAADAVVDWMHRTGFREAKALFDQALERGIGSISAPPEALGAFFEEVERVPVWLERGCLKRACHTVQELALGHNYVLFSLSLLAGYASAGITKTLAATGELEAMAPRRIAETSKFLHDVYASPTLDRMSAGFRSVIRVRMMHAFVRDKLLQGGWETERWGVPISQADMAATVLSFSITYLVGLRMLGFIIPRREREAVLHLWRYVGKLLGVEERLLPTSEKQSVRLLWLVASTQEGPDEDGRALARALLRVPFAYRGRGALGYALARFDTNFCAGLTRAFIGDAVADSLGLEKTRWKYAVPLAASANFCSQLLGNAVPQSWRIGPKVGRALNAYRMRMMLQGSSPTFDPRTVATGR